MGRTGGSPGSGRPGQEPQYGPQGPYGRRGPDESYEPSPRYEQRYGPDGPYAQRYGPGEPYRRYEPGGAEGESPLRDARAEAGAEASEPPVAPPARPSSQQPRTQPQLAYPYPYRQPPGEPDQLRDQLRQLLRYRTVLVVCVLLGLLAGGAFGVLAGGTYDASSEVTLRQATVDPFAAGGKPADSGISIASERQTAEGSTVAGLAARRLGQQGAGSGEPGHGARAGARLQRGLEVTNPPDTLILRFTYTAGTPERAAARANAFARAFLDNRKRQTDAQVRKMLDRYRAQAAPLRSRHGRNETADAQLSALDSKIADLTALDTTPGTLVRTALPPSSPAGPGLPLLLGLGAAVGLLLGLLAAWLRLVFDPRARSDAEVVRALDAPVLGTLPRGRGGALPAGGREAEEYRAVAFRIACDPLLAHRPQSVLVVAARGSGDTAAAVAVNLAASFVEMDDQVLLVEADLRTPSLTERLRSADGVRSGLSGVRTAARPGGRSGTQGGWPAGPQLSVDVADSGTFELVQGARVRNAARALRSAPASRLLARALEPGTRAVVYAPAVLSCADAVALCDRVGGVLLVCDPREVRRADLARVRELVGGSGGTVVGALLHTRRPGEAREARRARRISERDGAGAERGPGNGTGSGTGAPGAGTSAGPGRTADARGGTAPRRGPGPDRRPEEGAYPTGTGTDTGIKAGTGAAEYPGAGYGTGSGNGTGPGDGTGYESGPAGRPASAGRPLDADPERYGGRVHRR